MLWVHCDSHNKEIISISLCSRKNSFLLWDLSSECNQSFDRKSQSSHSKTSNDKFQRSVQSPNFEKQNNARLISFSRFEPAHQHVHASITKFIWIVIWLGIYAFPFATWIHDVTGNRGIGTACKVKFRAVTGWFLICSTMRNVHAVLHPAVGLIFSAHNFRNFRIVIPVMGVVLSFYCNRKLLISRGKTILEWLGSALG